MAIIANLRFRTRNRSYMPFDAIYQSLRQYEIDAEAGFPRAVAMARNLGYIDYGEIVDSVQYTLQTEDAVIIN